MPSVEGGGARREPTRRLFFALWPQEAEQLDLERASRDALRPLQNSLRASREDPRSAPGPRLVPSCNFHLTLAFLGSIPMSRVAQVQSIAAEVSREPCRVAELDESAAA